jgi:hypothetical protein
MNLPPVSRDLTTLRADDEMTGLNTARPQGSTEAAPGARVVALFNDLARECSNFIRSAHAVVGCVAWLTNREILASLATRPSLLIVQKEDFLRPDLVDGDRAPVDPADLRRRYARIPVLKPYAVPGLRTISYATGWDSQGAVRCMGTKPPGQHTWPRMHHKFLIALRAESDPDGKSGDLDPVAVWTGSFNPTANGLRSLENVVIIQDRFIASRYFDEFCWVTALSEPLDWSSKWVSPELRFGT